MESERQLAEDRVRGPAVGLIATAIVGVLLELASLAMNLLWAGASFIDEDEPWADLFTGAWGIVGGLVGLVVSAFIIWAAWKMLRLEALELSFVACILALVPCLSPCCVLTLPFGIWGLVVLNEPQVKQAFAARKSAGADAPPPA